jgi:hypothetical protein
MWLLRSSPLDLRALLWSKYWTGTVPLLVLALIITVFTNVLLKATPFMMAVSIGTILLLTLAIAALALGFGALYPQFDTENAAQIPTSFGGLVFMMTTVALLAVVIVLESSRLRVPPAARNEKRCASSPAVPLPLAAVVVVWGRDGPAAQDRLRRMEFDLGEPIADGRWPMTPGPRSSPAPFSSYGHRLSAIGHQSGTTDPIRNPHPSPGSHPRCPC